MISTHQCRQCTLLRHSTSVVWTIPFLDIDEISDIVSIFIHLCNLLWLIKQFTFQVPVFYQYWFKQQYDLLESIYWSPYFTPIFFSVKSLEQKLQEHQIFVTISYIVPNDKSNQTEILKPWIGDIKASVLIRKLQHCNFFNSKGGRAPCKYAFDKSTFYWKYFHRLRIYKFHNIWQKNMFFKYLDRNKL